MTRLALAFALGLCACEGPVEIPSGTTVVALAIQPSSISLIVGEFRKFDAIAWNANGNILPGKVATWSSSEPQVASVDSTGIVTALSEGDVRIIAELEGHTAEAQVDVLPPPVAEWREHTCAISVDGQAYCWGLGINGQVGNGGRTSALVPVLVTTSGRWVAITTGAGHSCAITTEGEVYCWGRGAEGQLGGGDFVTSAVPAVLFGGLRYRQVAAGERHTCALDRTGITRCWGWNFHGQIGNGTRIGQHSPVPIEGSHAFVQITAGGRHVCGLDDQGRAWCWGSNAFGQIGDATFEDRLQPVRAATSLSFRSLSAGARHTCGVDEGARVHCWGDNRSGQFGDGALESSPLPRPAVASPGTGSLPDFSIVASGASHTCGVSVEGSGYCWGAGGFGQLGNGNDILVANPWPLTDGRVHVGWSMGGAHTCVLSESLQIFCWGFGGFGQLGTGTLSNSILPLQVAGDVSFTRIGG